jgi:hypothetical protein
MDDTLRADALALAIEAEVEDFLILVFEAVLLGRDALEQISAHLRLRVGVAVIEIVPVR